MLDRRAPPTHSSLSYPTGARDRPAGPASPRQHIETDGWLFQRAQHQIVGDVVTLKEMRRRHAAQPRQ